MGLEDPEAQQQADGAGNKDVVTLYTRWQNEKYAPELLPYDAEVVDNISEVLEFVLELLEEDREDDAREPGDSDLHLRGHDLERVRYVLRDYLRIRLWKISQWPQHYMESAHMAFLSEAEKSFLREYVDLKTTFFEHRLLCVFPVSKKGLDERFDQLEMIRRPDLDKHVYCRVVGDIDPIDVPPTFSQGTPTPQEPLALNVGQKYLLRYSIIRKYFVSKEHEGKVALI